MGKVLVSIAAAQASPYVRASKPSEYIPFKGEFPLVDVYSSDKYNEEIFNHEFLEDCSDWIQKIVLQGQQMYLIETDFKDYLKRNGIFEKFLSMSASDKSTELVRFMNAANLSFERLKIN